MRRATILLAAVGLFGAAVQPAAAQFGYGYNNMSQPYSGGGYGTGAPMYGGFSGAGTPALSPYLDLVRGANTPAINYFLGTRAEIDRRSFQGSTMSNLQGLMSAAGAQQQLAVPGSLGEIPMLPQTGHLAAFGAYGTYYNYYGYGIPQRPYYPLNPMQARMLPQR